MSHLFRSKPKSVASLLFRPHANGFIFRPQNAALLSSMIPLKLGSESNCPNGDTQSSRILRLGNFDSTIMESAGAPKSTWINSYNGTPSRQRLSQLESKAIQ